MVRVVREKIPLFPILLVNFIGTLGFSIVIPFLVFLVTDFGGNAFIYGLLGATYSLFQMIGAPLLGRWSDTAGRKKILFISQAGTLVAWIIFLTALYLPVTSLLNIDSPILGVFTLTLPLLVLFIARSLDGITGGNVSVANAYLADITTKKDRSRNFGKMSISANLGFIVGPALAGLLGATALGITLPVLAAVFISVVATTLILFYLPESHVSTTKIHHEKSVRKVFGQCKEYSKEKNTFRKVIQLPHIPYLLAFYFLLFLGFNVFYTAFPIHAIKGLGWTVTQMGVYFSFLSLVMVVVQGPVLSKASKKFSDSSLIMGGCFVLGISFLLLTSPTTSILYGAAALFSLGNGVMWPSFLSLLSKVAGKAHQGAVQGVGSSSGSLASIIGLILGGLLYDLLGGATFLISGSIFFFVFLLSFRLRTFRTQA